MKATGIVRRIDDLGRVVIPKEIRKTMRIREGEPLEIYTDTDGSVIFKKYSPIEEMSSVSQKLCDSIFKTTGATCAIADRDTIVAVAGGSKKPEIGDRISDVMQTAIIKRATEVPSEPDNDAMHTPSIMQVIVANGDVCGVVFVYGIEANQKGELFKFIQLTATFIAKHLEN